MPALAGGGGGGRQPTAADDGLRLLDRNYRKTFPATFISWELIPQQEVDPVRSAT
jgi:hypothetical protein